MKDFYKVLVRTTVALGIFLLFPLVANADCFVRCTAASGVVPQTSKSATPCTTPPISLMHPDCLVFCQSYCNGVGNVRYCVCFNSLAANWDFFGFEADAARSGLVLFASLLAGAGILGFTGSKRC